MNKVNTTLNHGTLLISGELSRQTVDQLKSNEFAYWFAHGALDVDLHHLLKVDTAGLAWLLYLLESASDYTCQLSFSHIPEKLGKLITLSGIDDFFPITNN